MIADLAGKRVLILCDNDGLSRAIKLQLRRNHLQIVGAISISEQQADIPVVEEIDLIVVAMSSINSEPIVALAKASLCGLIGRVPLLIISDRPFSPIPEYRIVHLDFPFDIDQLGDKIRDILQWQSQDDLEYPSPGPSRAVQTSETVDCN